MDKSKLFGICIVFALVFASVNAFSFNQTLLDILLSNYDMGYDDGTFSASYMNNKYIATGARDIILNFSIVGTGTYDVKSIVTIKNENMTNTYVTETQTMSGSGIASFDLDGHYIYCRDNPLDSGVYNKEYDAEIIILQGGMQAYSKHLLFRANCSARPIVVYGVTAQDIVGQNTQGGPGIDKINATIEFDFWEAGTYTIGVYLTDNKTAYAYSERTLTLPSSTQDLSFAFEADKFKDFNLSNEKILLSKIFINGHEIYVKYPVWNKVYNTLTFSKSNFEFRGIKVDSYALNANMAGDKVSSLDAALTISNVNASLVPYDLEVSLENEQGEVVDVKRTTVTANGITMVTFDGTDVYNSRVNGPYRIGFARISKSDVDYVYEKAKGITYSYAYTNFTALAMADLVIETADITPSGNDYDVVVHNEGAEDAIGVVVTLFDENATEVDEAILTRINAGSSASYTFTSVGLQSVKAAADFVNLIEESNETNNIATYSAVVIPPTITGEQPSHSSMVDITGPLQFNLTLTGTGPFTITWTLDGEVIGSGNNFIFTPRYRDEGLRNLTVLVSNSVGNYQITWAARVIPSFMGAFAYAYDENLRQATGLFVPINANVTALSDTKEATNTEIPVNFNFTTNTVFPVVYSADGRQTLNTNVFFDSRLFTDCALSSGCLFTNTYDTSCIWESGTWACTIDNGAEENYFRMYPNPKRVKINGMLAVN